ncbi:hypothetical protein D3C79_849780 [compost metagenome]
MGTMDLRGWSFRLQRPQLDGNSATLTRLLTRLRGGALNLTIFICNFPRAKLMPCGRHVIRTVPLFVGSRWPA